MNGTDVEETEKRIARYESANKSIIASNAARLASESLALTKQEELLKQQREAARQAALHEEQEQLLERERQRKDLIRDLASSEGSAERILARNKAAALKRSSARRRDEEIGRFSGVGTFGMARVESLEEEEDGPFDPLDGQGQESSLYTVRHNYDDPYHLFHDDANGSWLDQIKEDQVALAGGFSLHDVYKRGLFEAYAGLGCILSEELSVS